MYLAHEADAEHAALLEKKTTVERDLARQTEEERTLTAQLAAETDAKAQLTADIDTARIAAEETAERGSIAGSEASDVDFDGVFQSNEAESFEDEAPTEVSLGGAPEVHHAVAALRGEVAATKARLDNVKTESGALSQATAEADAALAKRHVATQSLHAELLNVKAERILLQAEADGDDEDDGSGARDLSTEEVEFDSVFAVPRHHNSVSRPGEDPSTFEQATPNAVALPPSARAETTRLRATLEAARTQLKEVRFRRVFCVTACG